jgi:hypothetical protein
MSDEFFIKIWLKRFAKIINLAEKFGNIVHGKALGV